MDKKKQDIEFGNSERLESIGYLKALGIHESQIKEK